MGKPQFTATEGRACPDETTANTAFESLQQEIIKSNPSDDISKLKDTIVENLKCLDRNQLIEKLNLINSIRDSKKINEQAIFDAIDIQLREVLATKLWQESNGDNILADKCIPSLAEALRSDLSIVDIRFLYRENDLMTQLFTRKIAGENHAFKVELYGIPKFEIGLGLGDLIPAQYQVISTSKEYRFSDDQDTTKQWDAIKQDSKKLSYEAYKAHRMIYKGRPSYRKLKTDGSKGAYVETFSGDIIYGQPENILTDPEKLKKIKEYEELKLGDDITNKQKIASFDANFDNIKPEDDTLEKKFESLAANDKSDTDPTSIIDEFDPSNLEDEKLFTGLEFTGKGVLQNIWNQYGQDILNTSYKYAILPSVIISTISCESGGDPNAYNPETEARPPEAYETYKNDWQRYKTNSILTENEFFESRGLGQIRGMTAITVKPGIDLSTLNDPKVNIDLIGLVLKANKHITGNDPLLMRKAYIMGAGNAHKNHDVNGFMTVYENTSSALIHQPLTEFKAYNDDEDDSNVYEYDEYATTNKEKIAKEADFTGGNETVIKEHRIIPEPVEEFTFNDKQIKTKRSVYEALIRANQEFNQKHSELHIVIGDNFRSNAEQAQRKSQTDLAANEGHSFHELGQAFDLQLNSFKEEEIQAIEKAMRAQGFRNNVPGERWHFSIGESNSIEELDLHCKTETTTDIKPA